MKKANDKSSSYVKRNANTYLLKILILSGCYMSCTSYSLAASNVSMYGLVDAAVGQVRSIPEDRNPHLASSEMINNSSSRIGVKGVEELGGGLKVGFIFESGLKVTDGSVDTVGGGFWGRYANVWVAGPWGQITLGRNLSISHYTISSWAVPGAVNYRIGTVVYGYGSMSARDNSAISYKSPSIHGVKFAVGHVLSDDRGGNQKTDLGLMYGNDIFDVGIALNKAKNSKTNYATGARVKLGQAMMSVAYHGGRAVNGIEGQERKGITLDGRYTVGPWSYMTAVSRDTGNTVLGKKYTNYVLEGQYHLSKRTFMYAAYFHRDAKNNYGIGLQHKF